jgi:hypothetical protein
VRLKPFSTIPLMLLTAALLVNGCDRQSVRPSALPDDRFASLLAEVIQLQELYLGQPDSLKLRRAALLDSAGVTEEQIRGYIKTLQSRPEAWLPLLERVEARVDSIQKAKRDTSRSASSDSLLSPKPTEAVRYRAK